MSSAGDPILTRFYARQKVAHRLLQRVGEVLSVDFDEGLALVDYGDAWPLWARIENLQEVVSYLDAPPSFVAASPGVGVTEDGPGEVA